MDVNSAFEQVRLIDRAPSLGQALIDVASYYGDDQESLARRLTVGPSTITRWKKSTHKPTLEHTATAISLYPLSRQAIQSLIAKAPFSGAIRYLFSGNLDALTPAIGLAESQLRRGYPEISAVTSREAIRQLATLFHAPENIQTRHLVLLNRALIINSHAHMSYRPPSEVRCVLEENYRMAANVKNLLNSRDYKAYDYVPAMLLGQAEYFRAADKSSRGGRFRDAIYHLHAALDGRPSLGDTLRIKRHLAACFALANHRSSATRELAGLQRYLDQSRAVKMAAGDIIFAIEARPRTNYLLDRQKPTGIVASIDEWDDALRKLRSEATFYELPALVIKYTGLLAAVKAFRQNQLSYTELLSRLHEVVKLSMSLRHRRKLAEMRELIEPLLRREDAGILSEIDRALGTGNGESVT